MKVDVAKIERLIEFCNKYSDCKTENDLASATSRRINYSDGLEHHIDFEELINALRDAVPHLEELLKYC